jgi:hypothetical protein
MEFPSVHSSVMTSIFFNLAMASSSSLSFMETWLFGAFNGATPWWRWVELSCTEADLSVWKLSLWAFDLIEKGLSMRNLSS